MITPTIGRIVWFTPSINGDPRRDVTQLLAGIVSYVWSERMVNLNVFHQEGGISSYESVPLLQDTDPLISYGYYAQWMPYQIGSARRYEVENTAEKAWNETIADKE